MPKTNRKCYFVQRCGAQMLETKFLGLKCLIIENNSGIDVQKIAKCVAETPCKKKIQRII